MANLKKLKSKSYPFSLDFGDGDIIKGTIKAHSQGWQEAEKLKKELEAVADDDIEARHTSYRLFVEQVTTWDLCDDDIPIPLTVEGLEAANVPFRLCLDILTGAYEQVETVKKPKRRI